MLVIGKEISDNWGGIRKHLKKSAISEFKPIFDLKGRRALFGVDFDKVEEKINDILARYRNCVKTDISRFYGTIYTHSIPWALYGKSYCKKNHSQPKFKQSLGDRLDKFVRNSQSQQSIGIPVGPDFSRIIAEIIAVELDAGLNKLLNATSRRAVRYVDDIAVGYTQEENDDVIVSQIAKVLGEFELEVNLDKTHVLGVGRPLTPEWRHTIRRFRLSSDVRRQRADLEAYFKEALYLSELSPKDNVLDYALKRSTSLQIDPSNWAYYENFLLRISRMNSTTVPVVCQILIDRNSKGLPVDIGKVKSYIIDIIRQHLPMGHVGEISWCLFLLKGLNIAVKSKELREIYALDSSVCALIVLDLFTRGLISGAPKLDQWKLWTNSEGLKSTMWLLAYESILKGWLPKSKPCYIESDPFFKFLLQKKISFYNTKKNVVSLEKWSAATISKKSMIKHVFGHLDQYF